MNVHFYNLLLSFILVLILMPMSRIIAIRANLVDKPNHRKLHKNSIPIIGGIIISIASVLTLLLVPKDFGDFLKLKNIFIGSLIMLIMGIVDDKYDLKSILKLLVQIILAHYIYVSGIRIESLYGFLGIYHLPETAQYILTVIVIAGAVNAFNLMDGIDGLAAGLALISFSIFTFLAIYTHHYFLANVFIAILGALIGFLRFNFSSTQKVFMGDAGSLMLGFILVTSGIYLLQSANSSPKIVIVFPLVLGALFLPVLDSLRVYRSRIKNGKSPFKADISHFHHLILQIGLKHIWATTLIVSIVVIFISFIYLSNYFLGITLTIFILLFAFKILVNILELNSKINYWLYKIKSFE